MGWMMCAIFIVFFATSLPVLAFGEAFCGIPWGVFRKSTEIVFGDPLVADESRNSLYVLCRRARADGVATLCHGIRLHVLGRRYLVVIRCPTGLPYHRVSMGYVLATDRASSFLIHFD